MKNEAQNTTPDVRIQGLLEQYLRLRASDRDLTVTSGRHLDEDSLNAFVEGNLGEREAAPILTHLVNCSFCRHVTAELVRLDFAFAETERADAVQESREPTKVSEVLSGILSRIFGTNDGAVFAHQESEDDDGEKTGEPEKKDEE
jgi:hypothetical protein